MLFNKIYFIVEIKYVFLQTFNAKKVERNGSKKTIESLE
jgi:hypothetical protein